MRCRRNRTSIGRSHRKAWLTLFGFYLRNLYFKFLVTLLAGIVEFRLLVFQQNGLLIDFSVVFIDLGLFLDHRNREIVSR